MKADRELLEAAARAAGIRWDRDSEVWYGEPFVRCDWNPLTDDGDALRLAIHLRIDLCFEKTHSVSAYTERDEWFHEHCDQGKTEQILDKTRRAITRAAASMAA